MKALVFWNSAVGMAAAGHSTVMRSWNEYLPLTDSGCLHAKSVDRNRKRHVRVLTGLRAPAERAWRLLSLWRHRSRIRYQLRDLDDHILKEVGLSQYERFNGTSRLPWR